MSSPRATSRLFSLLPLTLSIGVCCLAPDSSAQERERPAQENEEIRTVRRRLDVMRLAVDAFLEADRQDAAKRVELAMHTRELAIAGVRNEKAEAVAKAAPNRGQLAELLGAASNLYEKRGKREPSQALAELAEVYAQQWRRQKRAEDEGRTSEHEHEHEGEHEGRAGEGLDSLERRVRILSLARSAYDKAGHERNEKALANAVRYGKLALEGSNQEALAKAAEGLPSRGNLIELLQGAHNLWAEWGDQERARMCHQLAEYYAGQLRAGAEQEHARAERGRAFTYQPQPGRGSLESLEQRIEVLRLVRVAHAEAGNRRAADRMERVLHLAELQLEGVSGEALAQASEGITQGGLIELVQGAQNLYREWGHQERSAACRRLAEFYRDRTERREGGEEREQGRERRQAAGNQQAGVKELRQQVERLERELAELKAILRDRLVRRFRGVARRQASIAHGTPGRVHPRTRRRTLRWLVARRWRSLCPETRPSPISCRESNFEQFSRPNQGRVQLRRIPIASQGRPRRLFPPFQTPRDS